MQSGREDTLEERYAIKFCFKLGKTATETYGMLQTAYGPSCMNRSSVFQWHKRFKESRESLRDDERCGRSREVRTSEMIGQINDFMNRDRRVSIETLSAQFNVSVGAVHKIIREELRIRSVAFPSGQCPSPQIHPRHRLFDPDGQIVCDETVPHPPYSPDLAPCDFWLFPKLKENLRGNRYSKLRT